MPSSKDFLDPGVEIMSFPSPALAGGFFTTIATWEAHPFLIYACKESNTTEFTEHGCTLHV